MIEDVNSKFINELQLLLLDWYRSMARDLPWRNTKNAYLIWISEIILQQTRVDQGLEYYLRFIQRFPDVRSLAEADEQEVLKYWQGLGYYTRARNLHAAAKQIMTLYKGEFPTDYDSVLSLKGVGEYTAAAIMSFAYDAPYAVLDGNVYRFLARLFAISLPIDMTEGKRYFSELAQLLLNRTDPSLHNQAMMEMGALQCVPSHPDCTVCPFKTHCLAFLENKVDCYPRKARKTKVSERYFHYLFISCGDSLYLHQRVGKDVWRNLYEFPLCETTGEKLNADEVACLLNAPIDGELIPTLQVKHVLSHCVIHASFYELCVSEQTEIPDCVTIDKRDLYKYPVSRLIHLFLEKRHPDLL